MWVHAQTGSSRTITTNWIQIIHNPQCTNHLHHRTVDVNLMTTILFHFLHLFWQFHPRPPVARLLFHAPLVWFSVSTCVNFCCCRQRNGARMYSRSLTPKTTDGRGFKYNGGDTDRKRKLRQWRRRVFEWFRFLTWSGGGFVTVVVVIPLLLILPDPNGAAELHPLPHHRP
jgi:hypothetical protein